jgi:hypothetical protein
MQSRENQTFEFRQACFLLLPKDACSKCTAFQKAHAVEQARAAEGLPLPLALLLLHALGAVPVTFWKIVRSLQDASKWFSNSLKSPPGAKPATRTQLLSSCLHLPRYRPTQQLIHNQAYKETLKDDLCVIQYQEQLVPRSLRSMCTAVHRILSNHIFECQDSPRGGPSRRGGRSAGKCRT